MSRKLIVLHHIPIDYSISGPIRFMIRMFNEEKYKKLLYEKYGLSVITSLDIKTSYNLTNREFVKTIRNKEEFANGIIFAIHPGGFSGIHGSLGSNKNIKYIVWQDDLHYFSNFAFDKNTSKQKYCGKFTCPILDKADYLVTPSPVYFKNQKITEYDNKLIDLFYFLNPDWFDNLRGHSYKQRLNKIILSGTTSSGYKSRIEFNKLKTVSSDFDDLIYKLERPTKNGDRKMTEMNYYNKLSEFKAAFVGHYEFPINFCLAKHIEVLMCGCLGFYEQNPLLESQLGLKAYEHYIPCCVDGVPMKDINFYNKWMNSEEGEQIAKNGQEYVMNNFGDKQMEKLFKLFKNC